MKRPQKRYYILIFVAALAVGVILRDFGGPSYKIIKTQAAYAPEIEDVIIPSDTASESLININTASLSELMQLPGVGEAIGMRIIEYRTQYGDFETVHDLKKITGIGEKKFSELEGQITVGD